MNEAEVPAINLRRATAGDAQAIGAVFDAAVRVGWTYLGELAQQPMFSPEDWERLVADHAPPNVLLVATDESDRVVGYAAVHPDDGEMFLLFVDPAHSGRGIGRLLLSAAHDALREAGCEEAFLFTHERNERAPHDFSNNDRMGGPDGADRAGTHSNATLRRALCAGSGGGDLQSVEQQAGATRVE